MVRETHPGSSSSCGCEEASSSDTCCASKGHQGHLRSSGTGLFLGLLASACCWLPIALGALGLASGAAASLFSRVRPWAFGALALLPGLVLTWWARNWFRWRRGGPSQVIPAPAFPTMSTTVLLLSLGGAWAIPHALLRTQSKPQTSAGGSPVPPGSSIWILATPQFDCAPCAGNLPQRLASTPGVASVQMDFQRRTTRIIFLAGQNPEAIFEKWQREFGFSGKVLSHSDS